MAFPVEARSRRVCSNVQSIFAAAAELSGKFELNAEAGMTDYLRVLFVDLNDRQPHMRVDALDEAEGLLMVSKTGQSIWKVKP